jgi:hypothetical protein
MEYSRSIPEMFTDLVRQLATLARTEAQLARAEASEKVARVGVGIGLTISGAALLIPGLVVLLQAAVVALIRYYGIVDYWASAIVGGAAFLLGFILIVAGFTRFRASRLTPSKTIEQIQRDAAVAKQQMGADYGKIRRAARA